MKNEKVRLYTIEFTLIIFLLLAMIFNDTITRQVTAVVLLVSMIISVKLIKTDKTKLTNNRQIIMHKIYLDRHHLKMRHYLNLDNNPAHDIGKQRKQSSKIEI